MKHITCYTKGKPDPHLTRHAIIIAQQIINRGIRNETAMIYAFNKAMFYGYKHMKIACVASAAYDMAMS